jgi:hypothetical protein
MLAACALLMVPLLLAGLALLPLALLATRLGRGRALRAEEALERASRAWRSLTLALGEARCRTSSLFARLSPRLGGTVYRYFGFLSLACTALAAFGLVRGISALLGALAG